MNYFIEPACPEDVPHILGLIKQLAEYEKAANEVTVTESILLEDGFGPNKIYSCFIARMDDGSIRGIALYYTKYSTWKGSCIFLEDIIVEESFRGLGIGKELFRAVYRIARESKAGRMEWQVLDWNEPAIGFYKRFNAQFDAEWINCKFNYEQLQQTAAEDL